MSSPKRKKIVQELFLHYSEKCMNYFLLNLATATLPLASVAFTI
jgi:hypothetical protein